RCSSTATSPPTTSRPPSAASRSWSIRRARSSSPAPRSTTRTGCRTPGSRSTTRTPRAPAAAGSPLAESLPPAPASLRPPPARFARHSVLPRHGGARHSRTPPPLSLVRGYFRQSRGQLALVEDEVEALHDGAAGVGHPQARFERHVVGVHRGCRGLG